MKYVNNKFIIIISLIALLNALFIFTKYDLRVFNYSKSPLNMFDNVLQNFKYHYPYSKIKTVGFYTDAIGDHRIHMLYELQDSIMPIFIDDSINHDFVFCYSDSDACKKFTEKNMEILGIYNNLVFCKRKDKR